MLEKKSKQTGNTYKEFNFKFNFAIKDLFFNNLLTYTDSSPVTLTEKGLYLDVDKLDVQKEIIEPSKKHWEELSKNNKKNKTVNVSDNEEFGSSVKVFVSSSSVFVRTAISFCTVLFCFVLRACGSIFP